MKAGPTLGEVQAVLRRAHSLAWTAGSDDEFLAACLREFPCGGEAADGTLWLVSGCWSCGGKLDDEAVAIAGVDEFTTHAVCARCVGDG